MEKDICSNSIHLERNIMYYQRKMLPFVVARWVLKLHCTIGHVPNLTMLSAEVRQ